MATTFGDVAGKLALLRRDLFQIRYPSVFDEAAARRGHSQALLPVINFILSRFSKHVATAAACYDLAGRRGTKYIENMFKLAREKFNMRIVLSSAQFLAEGYAERKLMFVHQLIVACREYHSTAVRQERLGVLQQYNSLEKKSTAPAAAVFRQEEQKYKNENTMAKNRSPNHINNNAQDSSVHCKVFSTPEEHRQLPKNLISAFNNQATEAAVMETEEEEEDALEGIQSTQCETEESYFSSETKQIRCGLANEGEIKYKEPPPPAPAPAPWLQDFLQLAQDTKDITTHMQTLEQRLENTNTQLLSLHTSSKAHLMVLENRILAIERQAQLHLSQKMPRTTHPFGSNFLGPNASQMDHKDANNYFNQKNEGEIGYIRWNSPLTSCFNPLYTEPAPEGPSQKVPPHPISISSTGPARAHENNKHFCGLERTEIDGLNAYLGYKSDLQGNPIDNRSTEREKNELDRSGGGSGSGGGPKNEKLNFQNAFSPDCHQYTSDTKNCLDSQDVLVSLRARLAEAQVVVEEAHTALHLWPS